jgi:dihydrofolate reductase
MRKIIATMQMTMDGMAAGADGGVSFLGTEPQFDWEVFDNASACVLGRKMYPEYESYWRSVDDTSPPDEIRYAEFANRTPHYVLTRTLSEFDWPVAQPLSDIDGVRGLRDEDGRPIYVVGGPGTLAAFIDAGLLDELRVTVHPTILGGGLPLLGNVEREHGFELVDSIPLQNGRVRLVYGALPVR